MTGLGRALAGADTLRLAGLPEGAGLEGALARLDARRAPPPAGHARALFGYASGDFADERVGLLAERRDAARWLRVELLSARRGGAGSLGLAGRHEWGMSGALLRGDHTFEVSYAQRGTGAELADRTWGEVAGGESGHLGWRWARARRAASLTLARGRDDRESFGASLAWTRREAQEDRAALRLAAGDSAAALEAGVTWTRARVKRLFDGGAETPFDRRAGAWQADVRAARVAGDGRLEATLALARHEATGHPRLAPALAYRFAGAGARGAMTVARQLAPAWSDLAAGEAAFLQRTWAGGIEVAAGGRSGARLALSGGVTHDRALVALQPFTDLWLRHGLERERGRGTFALATAAVVFERGVLGAGAEGFALARATRGTDPPHGARAHLEARRALFEGDLHAALRLDLEGMGPRASAAPRRTRLPGHVSAGARLVLRLGEATFALRMRNLEDRRRPEPWIDPATGLEALGTGRELRFALSWGLQD
jgi:hypothetical protein